MPARLDTVAKTICEMGHWRVTNLQLQKIMYLAQMQYMGENDGRRLADASFEAWDYGPVEPNLYRQVRVFGSDAIRDIVFPDARQFLPDDPRRAFLRRVCNALLPLRPGALVDMTHISYGAWANHYVPGRRHLAIPDGDIVGEYRARRQRQQLPVSERAAA